MEEFVNWNAISESDRKNIKQKLDEILGESNIINDEVFQCRVVGCKNVNHQRKLDVIFRLMKEVLIESTASYRFSRVRKYKIIPGWNDYVKNVHAIARKHFLIWKQNDKPLFGEFVDNMKESRAAFRSALEYCKKNEQDIRKRKILESFKNKRYDEFWRDINGIKKCDEIHPGSIDNESDPQVIANNFSDMYRKILDKSKKGCSTLGDMKDNLCEPQSKVVNGRISKSAVQEAIKVLKYSFKSFESMC